jgi:hypothetical protein
MGGFIERNLCEIPCTMDCECPSPLVCRVKDIKGAPFNRCVDPPTD